MEIEQVTLVDNGKPIRQYRLGERIAIVHIDGIVFGFTNIADYENSVPSFFSLSSKTTHTANSVAIEWVKG